MIADVFRVLGALAGSVAVFAFWWLFIVAIMVVTLYICRFIPLAGWRTRQDLESTVTR
jgi:hypothetical protein